MGAYLTGLIIPAPFMTAALADVDDWVYFCAVFVTVMFVLDAMSPWGWLPL